MTSSSSSSPSTRFSNIPLLDITTMEELHEALQFTKFCLMLIGLHMLIGAGFVAARAMDIVNSDALDVLIKKEMIQWFMAWLGVLLVSGLAALYAALASSINVAHICQFSTMVVLFLPTSLQLSFTYFCCLCFTNVVFFLVVELYIAVQTEMDIATLLVTENDNEMYKPLLDSENVPTATMLIV